MGERFKGKISIDIRDSVPDWDPFMPPKAPDGAPNVVYVGLQGVFRKSAAADRRQPPGRDARYRRNGQGFRWRRRVTGTADDRSLLPRQPRRAVPRSRRRRSAQPPRRRTRTQAGHRCAQLRRLTPSRRRPRHARTDQREREVGLTSTGSARVMKRILSRKSSSVVAVGAHVEPRRLAVVGDHGMVPHMPVRRKDAARAAAGGH
jgi:hypothetical protein